MSRRHALLPLAVLAVLLAVDAAAQAPGVLDRVALDFRSAYFDWVDRLLPLAQRTFVLLAGIEFVVAAALWTFRGQMDEAAGEFVLKFVFLAFWFALMFGWELWIPPIFDGFVTAGRVGAGRDLVSPSMVLDLGGRVYVEIAAAIGTASILVNPLSVFTVSVAAAVAALCYVGVAVMLTYVLIEAYLVLGASVLFLGFAGWRATAGFAEGSLIHVAHCGIKVFVVHLVVGLGARLAEGWAEYLRATVSPFDLTPVWHVLAGSLLFAAAAIALPPTFAGSITGRASLGLANAVRASR